MSFEKELYDYAVSRKHLCIENDTIPDELFRTHKVYRGLRDFHGKGVLTGLTRISEIQAFREENGERIPCDGQLWYRGYDIRHLTAHYCRSRFAFEKLTYLLIFGELPTDTEADRFIEMLAKFRRLPTHFVRDVIMKAPSGDIMNSMTRSTLTLASYDPYAQNNIKVVQMMDNIRKNICDQEDDDEVRNYLHRILRKQAFDKKGLIYGMGHAVYSVSDPREQIFRQYVEQLVEEKGRQKDYSLYRKVERLAPVVIAKERKIYKGVSPNVDFYSGFVYDLLGIPQELFTPLFAVSRISGWSAHRIEELVGSGKIIRPAYMSVMESRDFNPEEI